MAGMYKHYLRGIKMSNQKSFSERTKRTNPTFKGNTLLTPYHLNFFKPIKTPDQFGKDVGLYDEYTTINPFTGVVEVTGKIIISKIHYKDNFYNHQKRILGRLENPGILERILDVDFSQDPYKFVHFYNLNTRKARDSDRYYYFLNLSMSIVPYAFKKILTVKLEPVMLADIVPDPISYNISKKFDENGFRLYTTDTIMSYMQGYDLEINDINGVIEIASKLELYFKGYDEYTDDEKRNLIDNHRDFSPDTFMVYKYTYTFIPESDDLVNFAHQFTQEGNYEAYQIEDPAYDDSYIEELKQSNNTRNQLYFLNEKGYNLFKLPSEENWRVIEGGELNKDKTDVIYTDGNKLSLYDHILTKNLDIPKSNDITHFVLGRRFFSKINKERQYQDYLSQLFAVKRNWWTNITTNDDDAGFSNDAYIVAASDVRSPPRTSNTSTYWERMRFTHNANSRMIGRFGWLPYYLKRTLPNTPWENFKERFEIYRNRLKKLNLNNPLSYNAQVFCFSDNSNNNINSFICEDMTTEYENVRWISCDFNDSNKPSNWDINVKTYCVSVGDWNPVEIFDLFTGRACVTPVKLCQFDGAVEGDTYYDNSVVNDVYKFMGKELFAYYRDYPVNNLESEGHYTRVNITMESLNFLNMFLFVAEIGGENWNIDKGPFYIVYSKLTNSEKEWYKLVVSSCVSQRLNEMNKNYTPQYAGRYNEEDQHLIPRYGLLGLLSYYDDERQEVVKLSDTLMEKGLTESDMQSYYTYIKVIKKDGTLQRSELAITST